MLKQWGVNGPFSKHTGAQICISIRPNIRVFAATLLVPPWSRHTHTQRNPRFWQKKCSEERKALSELTVKTDGRTDKGRFLMPTLLISSIHGQNSKLLEEQLLPITPHVHLLVYWSVGQSDTISLKAR